MRLLIDTQIFIWWDSDPDRLSLRILDILSNNKNEIILSVASIWEIQIKSQLGKLDLMLPIEDIIERQQNTNNINILSINLSHVLALSYLPFHHKDPFDRIIMAQAYTENIPIISVDSIFKEYPVDIIT